MWPLTVFGQADAPERRRAPFAAGRVADLLPVGQALAHVVQQEIGIGPDQLELLRLVRRVAAVTNFGVWQEAQPAS